MAMKTKKILGGWRSVGTCQVLLCATMMMGCSATGESGGDLTPTSQARQALEATATPAAFTVKFDVPTGVALSDISVIGGLSVRAADRVQIPGLLASIDGAVEISNDAQVEQVSAHSSVRLGDRTRIKGAVQAGTTLTKGNQATIGGTVTTSSPPVPRSIQWSVPITSAALDLWCTQQDHAGCWRWLVRSLSSAGSA